jgi:lipopolysaccharide exporter
MKTIRYVSIISIPASLGISAISGDFIKVVYGSRWLPAVAALQVLCLYGLNRSLLCTVENLYHAAGKPEVRTKLNLLQLVLMALLMYPLTIRYGIMGAAVAAMVPSALVVVGGAVYAGYLWWRNREIFYEVKGLVGRR